MSINIGFPGIQQARTLFGSSSVCTLGLAYNEFGYSEHSAGFFNHIVDEFHVILSNSSELLEAVLQRKFPGAQLSMGQKIV